MDAQTKILRTGALVILCALLLRLLAPYFDRGDLWSLYVFLQTGRKVTLSQTVSSTEPQPEAVPATSPPLEIDLSAVQIHNTTGYSLDMDRLRSLPVGLSLSGGEPSVLILHSHGSESYTNTENYPESSAYRTRDRGYNMVSVGDRLTALLEEQGIGVIHERTMYDQPSYNAAYEAARQGIRQHLTQTPSLQLVLDLHRDAAVDADGNQIPQRLDTPQGSCARLMLVMGSDAGGLSHAQWEQNLALAIQLQARLEALCPGICRHIQLRTSRYNQDLSPGALLIEVGSAGNTRQEALLAMEYLALAINDLSQ